MAALRSALLVAVAVGAASGQELEDALRRQCAAALTQNFCALAFGTSPICVWTASSAGDAACQLPILEGSNICLVADCQDSAFINAGTSCGCASVRPFEDHVNLNCSCAPSCVVAGDCCPGYVAQCVTQEPSQAPVESTTLAPVSTAPSSSPSIASMRPTPAPVPNLDSCLCHANEPGCTPDARVGNWTGCGSTFGRLRTNGRRCYCDALCHTTRAGCCPDRDDVCVTQTPTSTPTAHPTAAPTTRTPTEAPSMPPTPVPTLDPTRTPSRNPTAAPTSAPSPSPSSAPTSSPSPDYGTCRCTDDGSGCIQQEHNGFTYCGTSFSRLTEDASHCYCDEFCVTIGNCCADYQSLCLTGSPTQFPTSSVPTGLPTPAPTPLFDTCMCENAQYNAECHDTSANPYLPSVGYNLCDTTVSVLKLDGSRCYCTEACVAAGNCCSDYEDMCLYISTSTTTTSTTTTTTRGKFYVAMVIDRPMPAYMSPEMQRNSINAIENMLTTFGFQQDLRTVEYTNGDQLQSDGSAIGPSEVLISFWNQDFANDVRNSLCECAVQTQFEFAESTRWPSIANDASGSCEATCTPTTMSPTNMPTTSNPTVLPTTSPASSMPTFSPSTSHPTSEPTTSPTTSNPTTSPTATPTTSNPTVSPTAAPTTTTPTEVPSETPTAGPSRNPTTDPCLVITCGSDCLGTCGWDTIVGHPNEGLCISGGTTTEAEMTLGCRLAAPPTIPRLTSTQAENDADASTSEAVVYLIVVFVLIVLAAMLIMWHGRNQRKKGSANVTYTHPQGGALPYTVAEGGISPISEQLHQSSPTAEPEQMSQQTLLEEQVRIRDAAEREQRAIEQRAREARAAQAISEQTSAMMHAERAAAMTPVAAAAPVRNKPRVPESQLPIWFHGELNGELTKSKLQRTGIKNGRFLVRKEEQSDNYCLCVVHRGAIRTFSITSNSDGFALHDDSGDTVGATFPDIPDIVAALSSDTLPVGWRVQLKDAVDRNTGRFVPIDAGRLLSVDDDESEPEDEAPATTGYITVNPPEESAPNDTFDPQNSASWLHGTSQGKEAAFAMMMSPSGEYENGTFLVEKHTDPGTFILNVNYKGRPTRHLISTHEDGTLVITKRKYCDATTIEGLVGVLSSDSLPEKWPVKLVKPILVGDGAQAPAPIRTALARGQAEPGASDLSSEASYLHGVTQGKAHAFAIIQAFDSSYPDGLFMIERHEDPTKFVLNVCFKQRPTRHLINANDEGLLMVNKKTFGGHTTLKALVASLSSPSLPAGWPVRLERAVPPPNDETPPPRPPKTAPAVAAAAGPTEKWIHTERFDKVAGKEWSTNLAGTSKNGRFIIRTHNGEKKTYVLSVVHKNKMTEHVVALDANGVTKINRRAYWSGGVSTIGELVDRLSTQPMPVDPASGKAWPAPLIEGHNASTRQWEAVGSGSSVSSGGKPSWLHPVQSGRELSREEAEDIIRAGELPSGKFVIRERNTPDEWVLSVAYKGRPTHHLINKTDDGFLKINKKDYGNTWNTISDLVATLSQPQGSVPGWPIPLLV